MTNPIITRKRSLTAVVGATAAATLLSFVPQVEGVILRGYKDPIGIVTACAGHTRTAVLGRPYTKQECAKLLEEDLVVHAEGVLKCSPILKDRPFQLAAASSFAFNNGVGAYCGSAIARSFNAGDFATGCARFNTGPDGKPRWIFVKDKIVNGVQTYKSLPGLITRRAAERGICES